MMLTGKQLMARYETERAKSCTALRSGLRRLHGTGYIALATGLATWPGYWPGYMAWHMIGACDALLAATRQPMMLTLFMTNNAR